MTRPLSRPSGLLPLGTPVRIKSAYPGDLADGRTGVVCEDKRTHGKHIFVYAVRSDEPIVAALRRYVIDMQFFRADEVLPL